MVKDSVDGEILEVETHLRNGITEDNLSKIRWRTKEGEIMFIKDMDDKHLRNSALFLMGMGYTKCVAPEGTRIIYLSIFRMEWERRMRARMNGMSKWMVQ